MEYWRVFMNWPIERDWKCETCGHLSLIWGIIHGVCRCNICHTQYTMRQDGERVTRPVSMLRPEYKEPIRRGWQEFDPIPLSEWTDAMFDEAFKLVEGERQERIAENEQTIKAAVELQENS